MSGLQIKVDTSSVDDWLDIAPKKTSIAVLRAVKRGTMAARTLAGRSVSKDMGLKVGDVKKNIVMVAPNAQTITGVLRASLRRIPLIKFGARGPEPSRGRGRVSYKSKGGRKTIAGGFISTMGAHRGVFKRKGRERLPVQELYGPSIGRVFDLKREEIAGRGEEAAAAELDRQLDRIYGTGSK